MFPSVAAVFTALVMTGRIVSAITKAIPIKMKPTAIVFSGSWAAASLRSLLRMNWLAFITHGTPSDASNIVRQHIITFDDSPVGVFVALLQESVRLEPTVIRGLIAVAERDGTRKSDVVRRILREGLEREGFLDPTESLALTSFAMACLALLTTILQTLQLAFGLA